MAQKVVAARDVDIYLTLDDIGLPVMIETGVNFNAKISGSTEDIGAIGTDEPIATDNGGTSYDITMSLQESEALTIKDALATATTLLPDGSKAHIRQIVEGGTISVHYHKRRDVPATTTIETYSNITGVEEDDTVERRGVEVLKTWTWKARGMTRRTIPLV